jgi:hypothetical protein
MSETKVPLQSIGVAGLTGFIAAEATDEKTNPEERFETQLGRAKVVPPGVMELGEISVNLSPDGLATSILLGDKLALSIGEDEKRYSASKVAILEIPVTVPDMKEETFLGYHGLVIGTVSKGEGTRVALTLDLGSTHHFVEFPFGKSFDGPIRPEAFFGYSLEELKQVEGPGGERTTVGVPTPPHYTAVLVLSIQCRTPQDEASVNITGLDVEIIRPRKAPKSPDVCRTATPAPNKKPTP